MQRMERNRGLCHREQKANFHKSGKNGLKMFVVVVLKFAVFLKDGFCSQFRFLATILGYNIWS